MAKCKQTITLEILKHIGKVNLKEPNSLHYLNDDIVSVVVIHFDFLLAVAPHTKRLNPCSLALMVKELWKLNQREAQQFGASIAAAYSYCMAAGSKAKTGEKLVKEVLAVYKASCDGEDIKQEVKKESGAAVKRGIPDQPLSPPPAPKLRKCLSSPSQIALMYAGGMRNVKVDGFVWTYILQTQTCTTRRFHKNLLDGDPAQKTNEGGEEGRRG